MYTENQKTTKRHRKVADHRKDGKGSPITPPKARKVFKSDFVISECVPTPGIS